MKIDRDGIELCFLLSSVSAAALVAGATFGLTPLKWFAAAVFLVCLCSALFFRDPDRLTPVDPDAAVSAADGVVIDAGMVPGDDGAEDGALRIAVFMSVFNVHVNRSPVEGLVVSKNHCDGKKLSAYNRRAEYENEHGDTDLRTPHGPVRIRQIAGLIARRVVTRSEPGDMLGKGDRIGLIRFGSRVDVFLPPAFESTVKSGDHVRAGETVIARVRIQPRSGRGGCTV
jgi:phosphatidylserine decarboxylase